MKINITETALGVASQSAIQSQMTFDDFAPILKTIDAAGYYSIECWGGESLYICLSNLGEDPWARLRKIRAACPNTKLQMSICGQQLFGGKPYPNDVVCAFIRKSVSNGIDIVRVFDPTNNMRNIEVAAREAIGAGAHAQGTICFIPHSKCIGDDYYKIMAREMEAMGCQSICLKDTAGIMSPAEAFDITQQIKAGSGLPIAVCAPCTAGLAEMSYLKAIEGGATIIDCATSSFASGASQPSTQAMNYVLGKMGYDSSVDEFALKAIDDFMAPICTKAIERGSLPSHWREINTDILLNEEREGEEQSTAQNEESEMPPAFEIAKQELGPLAKSEEDVLSYIAFPQIAEKLRKDYSACNRRVVGYKIARITEN